MIFYFNRQLKPIGTIPDSVSQNSLNASTLYFVAPFSPTLAAQVSFTLPTGKVITPKEMTRIGAINGVQDENGNGFSMWSYALDGEITAYKGRLTVQFFICTGTARPASIALGLNVLQGNAMIPPEYDEDTIEDAYETVYQALSAILSVVYDTSGYDGFDYGYANEQATASRGTPDNDVVDLIVPKYAITTDESGNNVYYPVTALGVCDFPNLETVKLPETLAKIGNTGSEYAYGGGFESCPKLKEIVIPESLTIMGCGVFAANENSEASGLQKITFLGAPPTFFSTAQTGKGKGFIATDNTHRATVDIYVKAEYYDAYKTALAEIADDHTTYYADDYTTYYLHVLAHFEDDNVYAADGHFTGDIYFNNGTSLESALAAKQDKIDSEHKLSADLIENGETNKVFTAADKAKLDGIEAGAQVNVIESISFAGTPLMPVGKNVDIPHDDTKLNVQTTPNKVYGTNQGGLQVLYGVDDTPTQNSVYLVKSGGVYAALQGKQNTLTFDSAPTENSTNPVTSGGVFTAINAAISSVYRYKGSVATYADLPSTGLTVGDVYNVEATGDNYAWTGTAWDKLASTVDLSGYQPLIDSSHKLSADLVDDTNSTNKFVTAAEKTQIATNASDIANLKNALPVIDVLSTTSIANYADGKVRIYRINDYGVTYIGTITSYNTNAYRWELESVTNYVRYACRGGATIANATFADLLTTEYRDDYALKSDVDADPSIIKLSINAADRQLVQFNANTMTGLTKIDWGDGTITYGDDSVNRSHTYALDTTPMIRLYGVTAFIGTNAPATMYGVFTYEKNYESITYLYFGSACTSITQSAFRLNNANEIKFSPFIRTVQNAFGSSGGALKVAFLPDCITSCIQPFANSYEIRQLNVPYGTADISNFFTNMRGLKKAIIPDGVTTIGGNCFENCLAIEKIEFPSSVTSISGASCFSGCSSLKTLVFKSPTPPTIPTTVFDQLVTNGGKVLVPYESLQAYYYATNWAAYQDIICAIPLNHFVFGDSATLEEIYNATAGAAVVIRFTQTLQGDYYVCVRPLANNYTFSIENANTGARYAGINVLGSTTLGSILTGTTYRQDYATLGVNGTITLAVNSWSNNEQTVSISALGANDLITISPSTVTDRENANNAGLFAIAAQNGGSVTFSVTSTPSSAINLTYFITRGKA